MNEGAKESGGGWGVAIATGLLVLGALWFLRRPPPVTPPPPGGGGAPTTAAAPQPGPPPARRSLGIAFGQRDAGLEVLEVLAAGAAEKAGLAVGDLLLAVDGRGLDRASRGGEVLVGHLDALGDAPALTFRFRRAGVEGDIRVELLAEGAFERGVSRQLIDQGVAQLVSLRRADGLWPTYLGRDEPSASTSALVALALRRADTKAAREALGPLLAKLVALQGADGGLTDPPALYPHRTYGSGLLLLALGDEEAHAPARARLREWLVGAQVQEAHGIDSYDARWGGWSYYETYAVNLRADISTARYALVALDAGRLSPDHPAWGRARAFLDECQNLRLRLDPSDPDAKREADYRDGGFGFQPRMSKAGSEAVGSSLSVFRSYGSATADGLLALLALDGVDASEAEALPRLDDRALAALGWLAASWELTRNPGFQQGRNEPWGQGVWLYWLAALAEGLHRAGVWSVVDRQGREHAWAPELVRQLGTANRSAQGEFRGLSRLMHEDSPVLAASFAVLALAAARDRLELGKGGRVDGRAAAPKAPPPAPLVLPAADAIGRGQAAFQQRGCAACHVDDGTGNGPGLVGVGAAYLGDAGSPAGARERLIAYLRDPSRVPGLLRDPRVMQSATSLGVTEAELSDLAAFLLSRTGKKPVAGAR